MRRALILNAVNPRSGGVLIRGERGTAKSTAARALAALLPEVQVVADCRFDCDPNQPMTWCTECRERAARGERLVVGVVLPTAALGMNIVEREGISFSHPARYILVGTMNPEEGDLRPQLLDRFALSVEIHRLHAQRERMHITGRERGFEGEPGKA